MHAQHRLDAPPALAGGHGDLPAIGAQPVQGFGGAVVELLLEVRSLHPALEGLAIGVHGAVEVGPGAMGHQHPQRLLQLQAHDLAHGVIGRLRLAQGDEGQAGGLEDGFAAVHQGAVDIPDHQFVVHARTTSKAQVRRVPSAANGTVPCHI